MSTFFLALFFRSAALYHPQRRAILHLKTQRRKVKEKNRKNNRPPFFDVKTLRSQTVRIILLSSACSAFGIYIPFISLAQTIKNDKMIDAELPLQTNMVVQSTRKGKPILCCWSAFFYFRVLHGFSVSLHLVRWSYEIMPTAELHANICAKRRCLCVRYVYSRSPKYKPIMKDTLLSCRHTVNITHMHRLFSVLWLPCFVFFLYFHFRVTHLF